MTTDTGMTAVGTIVETIGAETTGAGISGVEISGVESKPIGKLSAIVIGSATRIGPCGTVTKTINATIVASAKPRNNPGRKQPFVTGRNRPRVCKNACAVLKSALLRKICWCLCNQQTRKLCRSVIFAPPPHCQTCSKMLLHSRGRSLPIMVTTRVGQIRCNRWSERMQVAGPVECKRVVKLSAISQPGLRVKSTVHTKHGATSSTLGA